MHGEHGHDSYAGTQTVIRQIEERIQTISQAAEDKITVSTRRRRMNELQRQARKAWNALDSLETMFLCGEDNCKLCPALTKEKFTCGGKQTLQSWLLNNGFPASRQCVHTVESLGEKIKAGYSKPTLVLWLNDHVQAVECPDCGKQVLYRETRKRCTECGKIYPADRWAGGQPCECGSMNTQYAGCHAANRFGSLEYQLCETPGCRYSSPYTPLTVQELADKVQDTAGEVEP